MFSQLAFKRRQAFTLAELVVVLIVLGVTIAILVSVERPPRRGGGRRMQNSYHVRGIQQGMVTFSVGNGGHYPGLDSSGNLKPAIAASIKQYGSAAPTNADQSIVYAILLTNSFFTPDYAVSPNEVDPKIVPAPGLVDLATIDQRHYSYALLQFAGPDNAGRRLEWRETNNSQCPAVSDRSKAIDPFLATTSIHTSTTSADSTNWEGNIAWNDNHVTFETTGIVGANKIKIGADTATEADDLFLAAPVKGLATQGDAKMTYR